MTPRIAAAILAICPAATAGIALADGPRVGPATCPAERAVYEMTAPQTDETWRMALVPARTTASIASDLYLRLATPQRAYWFTFSVSQGYSGISVFPVSDPYAGDGPRDLLGAPFGSNPEGAADPDILGALRFLAFDADLNVAVEPPMRGEAAPLYLMMPEIGQALWYDAGALSEDETAERDPMPRGVFKRTECRVAPHPEALP